LDFFGTIYAPEEGQGVWYWMHLAQDKYQWRAVVKTVMSLRVPQKAGSSLTS